MRKAQVWKEFAGLWRVQIGDLLLPDSVVARSPLSESGWFLRLKDGPYGHGWVELLVDRTKHVRNIKETS